MIPDEVDQWERRTAIQPRTITILSSGQTVRGDLWEPIVCDCGEAFASLGRWSQHRSPGRWWDKPECPAPRRRKT